MCHLLRENKEVSASEKKKLAPAKTKTTAIAQTVHGPIPASACRNSRGKAKAKEWDAELRCAPCEIGRRLSSAGISLRGRSRHGRFWSRLNRRNRYSQFLFNLRV